MTKIRQIILLTHPIQLILVLLSYGMGLGFARYLGATIQPEPQFLGGALVIIMTIISSLLIEHFRPHNEPIFNGETQREREELRSLLLFISVGFLAVAGFLIFLLQRDGYLNTELYFFLGFLILLSLSNAVPPFRLINRSLGELSGAILLACIIPSIAFVFQFGSLNRLVTIFTFPIFLLAFAYFIALNFPAYSEDLKFERHSLLMSLTWQKAVPFHNGLLISAYIFFSAIPFLGVPLGLVWPAFLTLPLVVFQVFTMRNLADGARPNWSVMITTATAIFGLTTYLIALTFWLR